MSHCHHHHLSVAALWGEQGGERERQRPVLFGGLLVLQLLLLRLL